ncbi:MAG TPA: 3-phosphoshikimate 1-carboxyvinyltransferase [Luteibacter sp.]|jgi:3-phosphoshikimate 1-carboxyvinyltransferase|uniref:3-phosphoshikimate 1-carboxyvinyltransferase n=1 Tax=Luteibacter sp. TaxID=1886636 RepID=UPI002F3E5FFF
MTALAWVSRAAGPIHGELVVPGDKSVSHRALMFGALAEGTTHIRGFLEGEDTRATAAILGKLGVRFETPAPGERVVHGVGLHGLRGTTEALDCGNAGTGMRLLAGLLAGQSFASTLVGDASLSGRPMRRVTDPLGEMGAQIDTNDGKPPLRIHGGGKLKGITYHSPVASAQIKSALLLAGLYAEGSTEVIEPHPTRDYTESMLKAFGWPIEYSPGRAKVEGGHVLRAVDVDVPADFSSAAFFIVAACIVPGSHLRLKGVGLNPRRTGLLAALKLMGADIAVENERHSGGEVIADLVIRQRPLHGVALPLDIVPDMIDEFPALFVAAACAEGMTTIRGAAELRVKESDRIATMAHGLKACGVLIDELPDGAMIRGGAIGGGSVDSHGDHRIAMSFAIAGLVATAPITIGDCANVATSFPGFIELANGVGFKLGPAS